MTNEAKPRPIVVGPRCARITQCIHMRAVLTMNDNAVHFHEVRR